MTESVRHGSERPRAALIGLDPSVADSLGSFFPSAKRADSVDAYEREHSTAETDVVVAGAVGNLSRFFGRSHILNVDPYFTRHLVGGGQFPLHLGWTRDSTNGREFIAEHEALDGVFSEAIEETVGRLASDGPLPVVVFHENDHPHVPLISVKSHPRQHVAAWQSHVLSMRDGAYPSAGTGSLVVGARHETEVVTWCRAWLSWLHSTDPDRVPRPPSGPLVPEAWYTEEEQTLADEIENKRSLQAALEAEIAALGADLQMATVAADQPGGARDLLHEAGDALEDAVERALRTLGFFVMRGDRRREDVEPRMFDLVITDAGAKETEPGAPPWTALATIRGYDGDVSVDDASTINRNVKRYLMSVGGSVDAVWWIVNPFRQDDPSTRTITEDVERSARIADAAVILTTDLYQLGRAAERSQISNEDARELLRTADAGRWVLSDSAGDEAG